MAEPVYCQPAIFWAAACHLPHAYQSRDYNSIAPAGKVSVHTVLYSHGKLKDLGESSTIPNTVSINDRDQVIGFRNKAGDAELLSDGRLIDVGSFKGLGSVALGINNHGTVVGYSDLTPTTIEPFESTSGSGPVGVAPIETINPGTEHAFVYEHGHMSDLGTLGGSSSEAVAVNNHGDIVGWSNPAGNDGEHAFLYHNGTMTDLGTLGGFESGAVSVNDKGQVVGWSYLAENNQIDPFLYSHGKMVDLNTLVPTENRFTLGGVVGINNHGEIAAVGSTQGGGEIALLLTSVRKRR
jgi:probable HAF family extracellular repeat protein